jgi:hypothetical protein
MLQNILDEIEKSQGVISLAALSQNLHIQKSALQGILQLWVRKGKIRIIRDPLEGETLLCADGTCNQRRCDSCELATRKKLVY